MQEANKGLYPTLINTIKSLATEDIAEDRKVILQILIDFIQDKIDLNQPINLNFICTHNSRRSQFAQLWAQVAAYYYGLPVNCFSGGVEETAVNERAIAAIERAGFKVNTQGGLNPRYAVAYTHDAAPVIMYSKLFDDKSNPAAGFVAVMTCSQADENCPFIPGSEKRIPLLYDDPKAYDDTAQETIKYTERSRQIATEMFYTFSQINQQHDPAAEKT
jgi:arsenate reductase